MRMKVGSGDEVYLGDREFTVSPTVADCLPAVRAYLIGIARAGGTVTYGELVRDLELEMLPRDVGRILDALSVDCFERDEPLLATLVVNEATLESSAFSPEEADAARELVHRRWLSRTIEGGGLELLGPVRGVCPRCGSREVTRIIWGMQPGPDPHETQRLPHWVDFGGCCVEPYNAACDNCGDRWTADELGRPTPSQPTTPQE